MNTKRPPGLPGRDRPSRAWQSGLIVIRSSIGLVLMMILTGATAVHAQARQGQEGGRPNILFIMSDDHAAHAVSCYGSRINRTPNLDRLASQGVRFTNMFCTNSICTPARAVVLTGLYSHKNGVLDNSGVLPRDRATVADALRTVGYQTAIIGKWHLNRDPTGFDHWDILPGQGVYNDPEFITNGTRARFTGYVTDITAEKCMDWIRARDPSRPFLVFCHFKAPHREWQPDAAHARMYDSESVPLPETFDDDYSTRSRAADIQTMTVEKHLTRTDLKADPPPGLTAHDIKVWKYQRFIKDYLRCVASIDDNVGRIMDFLDKEGLARDTVVIYTSDQGFFLGDHGWFDKRFMYEEALRSPLIVRYPAEVAPGDVCDAIVLNLDYAPTFLDFAGLPASAMAIAPQGESLRPLLKGQAPKDWRRSMYYHYYESGEPHTVPKHYGVRTARYTLIRFYELDEWELFDLEMDPRQVRNVYADPAYTATVAELQTELKRLRERYEDTTGPEVR